MSYTLRLHPKADEEFIQAYAWYEERQEGLGEKFITAIRAKLKAIAENPEYFSSKHNLLFREASVETFPYIVIYKIYRQKNEIFISSIHHAKKHPKTKYRK